MSLDHSVPTPDTIPGHESFGQAQMGSGALLFAPSTRQVVTRLKPILAHVPWYMTEGMARLADDLEVSHSTISRIASGRRPPSHAMAQSIAQAISRRIGYRIPVEEIFSTTGAYLTGSTCELCDCGGCLPEAAFNRNGDLKRAWRNARPGDWCRYPEEIVARDTTSTPDISPMPQ